MGGDAADLGVRLDEDKGRYKNLFRRSSGCFLYYQGPRFVITLHGA